MQQTNCTNDFILIKDIPSNWFPLFSLIMEGKYNNMPVPSKLDVYGVDNDGNKEKLEPLILSDWDIDNRKITFHFNNELIRDSYEYANLGLDVHDNSIAVLLVK